MRSRAVRLTISAVAFTALAAAAFFLFQSEQQIATRREAARSFDLRARAAIDGLADARAAQRAYVAAGQGPGFWMPKVEALSETSVATLDSLRRIARASDGQAALMEAQAAVAEFINVDRRVREYISTGEPLMAADVVFSAGDEAAERSAHGVETARLAEHRALDAFEAALRLQEAYVAGGAAAFAALVLLLLAVAEPAAPVRHAASSTKAEAMAAFAATGPIGLAGIKTRQAAAAQPSRAASQPPAAHTSGSAAGSAAPPAASAPPVVPTPAQPRYELLRQAADLCTDLGRLNDAADLPKLLTRSAELMDASGLIVWMGDVAGGDLRPVLADGYPAQALTRMPAVPKSADNAAAAAYRTSKLQIVLARPGVSNGAVVAPLLSPLGCIGALSAEIKGGGETSDGTQAIAALVAAQLAGVVAASASAEEDTPERRTASA